MSFKNSTIELRAKYLHPFVFQVMEEMIEWCLEKGVNPVVTETVTTLIEDAKLGRLSKSHQQGRAFDLRSRDWPRPLLKEFEDHFNSKYGKLGAIGGTTLQPDLIVWHDAGFGEHFHIQFNKSYLMTLPKVLE